MLDNAFKISIDPIFPPADLNFKRGSKSISINFFRLIFDDQLEKSYFANQTKERKISQMHPT